MLSVVCANYWDPVKVVISHQGPRGLRWLDATDVAFHGVDTAFEVLPGHIVEARVLFDASRPERPEWTAGGQVRALLKERSSHDAMTMGGIRELVIARRDCGQPTRVRIPVSYPYEWVIQPASSAPFSADVRDSAALRFGHLPTVPGSIVRARLADGGSELLMLIRRPFGPLVWASLQADRGPMDPDGWELADVVQHARPLPGQFHTLPDCGCHQDNHQYDDGCHCSDCTSIRYF